MRVPSTDGVDLELHELGGQGPTLLIAHATGFCAGAYRPLAASLADRFRVWALDFRAHGDSTTPADGDLDWGGMADDVLAVVDALTEAGAQDGANARADSAGGGAVVAIGHSMGGAALVAAELRRPGTIERAFLFEPIIFPEVWARSEAPNPLAESARRRRPTFASRAEAIARYASRPPLGRFRADALWSYVEHGFGDLDDGTVALKCTPEREAATFDATGKPTIEDLGPVATEILVAYGEQDSSPGPADFAPLVAEALPNGRTRCYDHLGHFGPLQDPDTIADDAAAFLRRD